MMHKIIVGALGLAAGVAGTPVDLVERTSCKHDMLYNCFADGHYASAASAYCSDLTPYTETVTAAPPTATQTVWQTSTALTSTDFITSITTVYSATDASSTTVTTTTATATATETDTITTTVTPSVSVPLPKRLVSVGAPEPPRCMTNKCVFYSPDRITSACRCIDVPAKTVTVTATTYSITETLTSISTVTPSVTVTAWQTVTTVMIDGVSISTSITTFTSTEVTTTTTVTTTAASTPAATNLVPNGDFTDGFAGWGSQTSAGWANAGVGPNGPNDVSAFGVEDTVANNPPFFLGSPSFALSGTDSYTMSFETAAGAAVSVWSPYFTANLDCGGVVVATADMSQATNVAFGWVSSTTTFTAPPGTNECQVTFVLEAVPKRISWGWYITAVSVVSNGPAAPLPTP